uniref:Uncharacterized protein n=1 Tax=Anguilla anguilla TaxID=7936 RepID=A0A0E9T028_ANGAN
MLPRRASYTGQIFNWSRFSGRFI